MKFSDTFYIIIGFLVGTVLLCLFSILQNILIGADFIILRSYIAPFSFGGVSGAIIGYLWYRNKKLSVEKIEVEQKATTDELTGLYNRRGFFALANHQTKLANRNKMKILLIYTDIDDLKKINDTLGHQKGDNALIETANILKKTFRKSDIIARIGGDEFVVFSIDATEDNYKKLTSHLRDNLESFNKNEKKQFNLSLSFGKAIYDYKHPISIDKLLSKADAGMYKEKLREEKSRA